MKHFVMTIALAFCLSVSAMAGDIHTGDFVPPPPPPSSSATSPGDIPTVDVAGDIPSTDLVQQISNEAKLIVLRTIFSWFAR